MKRGKRYYFKATDWYLGKPKTVYLASETSNKEELKNYWDNIGCSLDEIQEITEEEYRERIKQYEV